MPVSEETINALLEIQQLDLEEMRAIKRRDALPQRAKILELRKKKAEVEAKNAKIEPMRKDLDEKLAQISAEDERLAEKQRTTQEKIDSVEGDYRNIESLTRDLNGLAKRRVTLEEDLNELGEKLDQVKGVQDQINTALKNLGENEQKEIVAFQKEGGAINEEIAVLTQKRTALESLVDATTLSNYHESVKRNNGIGIAELINGQCSVCRNVFADGKILKAKAEAPLTTCPFCKRLLVVN